MALPKTPTWPAQEELLQVSRKRGMSSSIPLRKKNRWDSKLTLKWAGVGRWNDTLSGVTASTSSEDAGKIQVKLDDELVARNAVQ